MTFTSSKLLAATTIALSLLTTSSFAFTPAEQQQLCTPDALRLCGAEIPDVDRVTACMIRQKAQLSDGCKSVFAPAPVAATHPPASVQPASVRSTKPINLVPAQTKRPRA